ncbi:MAG TPA: hypothetical protein VGO50_02670 [Pyrinomonadaceae bacterium]|jgi:hypothetical protein|nr:hypothetical protein [Pyrinomonadaceae bacterium]
MKGILLITGLLLCLTAASHAQINNWENVKSVPDSHRVIVETMQGKRIKARFASAADDQLVLEKSGKTMTVSKSDVRRVYLGKKGKSHLGGIIGGVGGFFVGGFLATAIYNQGDRQGDGLEGIAGAVPGAVGGAILGRRVGGGTKEKALIYEIR